MYTLGIDIGSATSKCALLKDGSELAARSIVNGGIGTEGPQEVLDNVLKESCITMDDIAFVTATGYGRNLYSTANAQVSELSCHALGAHSIFPEARTIIDIGGQDVKVISLDDSGRMKEFLMNDKCAAGTGRFLEVMANVLRIRVDELAEYAAQAVSPASISSTCTVFAESEVISQLANGISRADLVAGICESVSHKVTSLAKRLAVRPEICMSGGVAQNSGVRLAIEKQLQQPILYSPQSQLFGALGAAIYGYRKAAK